MAGALMGAGLYALEGFVLRRNSGGLIRPLPFLVYFALRTVLYLGVIAFSLACVNQATGAGFGPTFVLGGGGTGSKSQVELFVGVVLGAMSTATSLEVSRTRTLP